MMRSLAFLTRRKRRPCVAQVARKYNNGTIGSGQKFNDTNLILLRKKQTKFGESYGKNGMPIGIIL
jgi:hypothetical protein